MIMIQDLGQLKYDDTFKIREPKDGDYLMVTKGSLILFDENYNLPVYNEEFAGHHFVYLFKVGDSRFFYLDEDIEEFSKYTYKRFNSRMRDHEKWMSFSITTAFHFADWYRANRYCGRCGKKNSYSTNERMIYCEDCHMPIYPKISPAIIIAVVDGDRIIATKRTPESTTHALISGFCEVGETVEETCHREVMEEVGVKIKNIRYYKSQPWSFSQSLLLGFIADLDGDDTLTVDYNENAGAYWLNRDEVGIKNDDFSLTREMLDEFAKGLY